MKAVFLKRNFDLVDQKITKSDVSHVHYGSGSYLVVDSGIKVQKTSEPTTVLIFQEGNAIPKGATRSADFVTWRAWWPTTLRGITGKPHFKLPLAWLGDIINIKTAPFLLIGIIILYSILSGGGF